MPVRSLDPLDLPTILRHRRQVVMLDAARRYTAHPPFSLRSLPDFIDPQRRTSTLIHHMEGRVLIGQVTQRETNPFANLGFLTPGDAEPDLLMPLLEQMLVRAGEWGCLHLLAEVDEDAPAFASLRRAGFSMYAWQRAWKLGSNASTGGADWQPANEYDLPAIQSLHNQIVPALLQLVEPMPRTASGLVCRKNGELQAYLAVTAGAAGTWLQPLIHPEAECKPGWLNAIPSRKNRPVYVCVRGYQAWLESMISDLDAEAGTRQAVLIRHLALHKRAESAVPVKKVEPAWAKPATPLTGIHPFDGEV